MYKLAFCLSFLAVTYMATAQKIYNDPNVQVRSVSGFHAIHISSAFEVALSQGTEEKVAVSADDEKYISEITTSVSNGVLTIRFDESNKFWQGNHHLKAYISVKNLDELKVSGATTVNIDGSLSLTDLKLQLSGASKLEGKMTISGKFAADLNGASDMNISGSANETTIDARGASDVKAYDFTTSVCTVDASGACTIKISVDKELSASLSGASSVNYKGSAMIRNIKTSGASNISHKS